jgi:chromosome segregation ATPase
VKNVNATEEQTKSSLDVVLKDFDAWRQRMNTQYDETSALFTEKLNTFSAKSEETMQSAIQSFEQNVLNYNQKTIQENNATKEQLENLKKEMAEAIETYQNRSTEVVTQLQENYDSMISSTEAKINGLNVDSEQKLRTLKTMVSEIKEKTDIAQEKAMEKIRAETNALNISLNDIDKRLKQFVASAQIIEKTEAMRKSLEDKIGVLRGDIAKFDNFKQVANEVEKHFEKIRKMEEDVSAKMQKFSGEKKRLDSLEDDFNHLMTLSSTMDKKISGLQNSYDELQAIETDIRKFSDSIADLSSKYERIEKKTPVLEQTILGVDKSFENLKELEKRLAQCDANVQAFPEKIGHVQQGITKLLNASGSINDAVDKLASLDNILAETENRIEAVVKSRDSIAKTEARLQEVSKDAQSQVKLFQDLVRADKQRKSENEAGAPPLGVRENVIKLAHQGWKPEEIGRSLNIPLGQVELILDYFGKEGR